jgi:hypothetical protein
MSILSDTPPIANNRKLIPLIQLLSTKLLSDDFFRSIFHCSTTAFLVEYSSFSFGESSFSFQSSNETFNCSEQVPSILSSNTSIAFSQTSPLQLT